MRRSLEVGHIFRAYGAAYRDAHGDKLPIRHLRVMRAVELCRTAELGGQKKQGGRVYTLDKKTTVEEGGGSPCRTDGDIRK